MLKNQNEKDDFPKLEPGLKSIRERLALASNLPDTKRASKKRSEIESIEFGNQNLNFINEVNYEASKNKRKLEQTEKFDKVLKKEKKVMQYDVNTFINS